MNKRIPLEDEKKDPVIVAKQDFEADLKRGYTAVEVKPAGIQTIINRRNPARNIVRPIPAVIAFRCMRCQFDCVNSEYPDKHTGGTKPGEDLIREHVFRREHPWPYAPFTNPYGDVEDIRIEGIDNDEYSKEIETKWPL